MFVRTVKSKKIDERMDSKVVALLLLLASLTQVDSLSDCAPFLATVDGVQVICSGHGDCTSATKRCKCVDGWGSDTDIAKNVAHPYPKPDCSEMMCPFGKSWADVPTSATTAHGDKECSDAGTCDRETGICTCFPGFEGSACDRMTCKFEEGDEVDCSGHGRCLSLLDLAKQSAAQPLSAATSYGGYITSTTWDEMMIRTCLCDSSWSVGLASGETQLPEYFGRFCQYRRCPSGNDPMTTADDTDCENKIQSAILGTVTTDNSNGGATGNKCYIECSRRGICDHESGKCLCYAGYAGQACESQDAAAPGEA
mmetsp:Transcript_11042/g.20465  ORF Transcript_11042/g.20465 Transcript_11042/m.20465 type:complete len:311 (-) Transcript_11042:4130-5062(-)